MKTQTADFDEAYSSLHRLGIPHVLPALDAAGLSISRRTLGGSHSVAVYPPIDSLTPLDPNSVLTTVGCANELSLYVHIPFCETRCTFCHYAVEQYDGERSGHYAEHSRARRYLKALTREMMFWSAKLNASHTVISSVYIGGGTPLILERAILKELLDTIQSEYNILAGAEICLEGSPLTIAAPSGEDKLRFLRENGVTRLSFGVQSFSDEVLKFAARGYKRDIPLQAAMLASQIFDNWNIDLIQGLYMGSPYETWENLKVIADLSPPHITWYHGRFGDRPQGQWQQSEGKCDGFEDDSKTLLGRMLIWQKLAALGYNQIDGNRFVREHRYVDPFKTIRTSASKDLLGFGAAAYSHIGMKATEKMGGYVFRNETDIQCYESRALSDNTPIATGRMIDEKELLAASYATGLRNGRVEDPVLKEIADRNPNLAGHYDALVAKLSNVDVLEHDSQSVLRISKLGKLFEDEVLALFFSPPVQRQISMSSSAQPLAAPSSSPQIPDLLHTITPLSDDVKRAS